MMSSASDCSDDGWRLPSVPPLVRGAVSPCWPAAARPAPLAPQPPAAGAGQPADGLRPADAAAARRCRRPDSGPVVYLIAPVLRGAGQRRRSSSPQTYLYYIQLKPSRPSQGVWVPWNEDDREDRPRRLPAALEHQLPRQPVDRRQRLHLRRTASSASSSSTTWRSGSASRSSTTSARRRSRRRRSTRS